MPLLISIFCREASSWNIAVHLLLFNTHTHFYIADVDTMSKAFTKRGLTLTSDLWTWWFEVVRDILIACMDSQGKIF